MFFDKNEREGLLVKVSVEKQKKKREYIIKQFG